jgi:capsular polysaccharide biosynthesis protein
MQLDNLLVVQNPTTGYSYLPSAVRIIKSIIDDYIAANLGDEPTKRIYLARPSDRWRCVLNEPELVSNLARLGIVSINPGDLRFSEQIALFSNANFLTGMHGSAFINMIFSRNCSSLELIGNYGDVHMVSLSTILRFRHRWTRCKSNGIDISANVDEVTKHISEFLDLSS